MNCPKQTKLRPGSFLIEMMAALALLTAISFVVLKSSIDLLEPRQAVLHQNLSDSYLTFEEALAARVSFAQFTATDGTSPWPLFPATNVVANVNLGQLPGGLDDTNTPVGGPMVTGTVTRTRTPDPNNLPAAGGTGTSTTNPAEMETWRLESHLTYQIGNQTYVKSRTMIRTQ